MIKTNEGCKKLERILKKINFAVLELNLSKEDMSVTKKDLEELGYKISHEIKDEKQGLYHIHITKFSNY